eukprot:403330952
MEDLKQQFIQINEDEDINDNDQLTDSSKSMISDNCQHEEINYDNDEQHSNEQFSHDQHQPNEILNTEEYFSIQDRKSNKLNQFQAKKLSIQNPISHELYRVQNSQQVTHLPQEVLKQEQNFDNDEQEDNNTPISPPMDYNKWRERRLKKIEDFSKILSSNHSQSIDEGMFSNRKKESEPQRYAHSSQKKYIELDAESSNQKSQSLKSQSKFDSQIKSPSKIAEERQMFVIDQESSDQEQDSLMIQQNLQNYQDQNHLVSKDNERQQLYLGKNVEERNESALERNYNKPLQMANSGSPPNKCSLNDIYPNPFHNQNLHGSDVNNTQYTSSFGFIANEMNQFTFKHSLANNLNNGNIQNQQFIANNKEKTNQNRKVQQQNTNSGSQNLSNNHSQSRNE